MMHEMNVCANAANVGLLVGEWTDAYYGWGTDMFADDLVRDAKKPHKQEVHQRISVKDYFVNRGFEIPFS